MKRFVQIALVVGLIQLLLTIVLHTGSVLSVNLGQVDKQKLTVKSESEYIIAGYLMPLNGKYKLRTTETILEPGGYLGQHHHAGPGIRFIEAGAITSIHPGKTIVYKTGDHFYEPGNQMHAFANKTKTPARILNIELLPVNWQGISAIPLQQPTGNAPATQSQQKS